MSFFHRAFRFVFTITPFILVSLMFFKMYEEKGLKGILIVFNSLLGMGVGVGFLFLIAYLFYQKDKQQNKSITDQR